MAERRRSPLRLLAPLALIAFALAFFIVISAADNGDDSGSDDASERTEQRDLRSERRRERRTRREDRLPQRVYVVKEGDTLGSISEKTGVPVEKLQELNPNLDPQALVTGQEVRLRE